MAFDPESLTRIEPARIEALTGDLPDILADLSARAAVLGKALHPRTAHIGRSNAGRPNI